MSASTRFAARMPGHASDGQGIAFGKTILFESFCSVSGCIVKNRLCRCYAPRRFFPRHVHHPRLAVFVYVGQVSHNEVYYTCRVYETSQYKSATNAKNSKLFLQGRTLRSPFFLPRFFPLTGNQFFVNRRDAPADAGWGAPRCASLCRIRHAATQGRVSQQL